MAPAQRKEIGIAVRVSTIKTGALQKPTTLCQFQSRALPVRFCVNQIEGRSPRQDQERGIHKYNPVRARTQNAMLHTPLISFPRGRLISPLKPR